MPPAEGTAARAPAAASRGPSHPPPAGDYPSAGEEGDATAPPSPAGRVPQGGGGGNEARGPKPAST